MISARNGMNALIQAMDEEDTDLIKRMISQVFTSHEIAKSSQNIKDSKTTVYEVLCLTTLLHIPKSIIDLKVNHSDQFA